MHIGLKQIDHHVVVKDDPVAIGKMSGHGSDCNQKKAMTILKT